MSMRFYDQALTDKIKNWVKDENLTITSPNETRRLFSYVADVNDDKPINLPLISLRRETQTTILNPNKQPLTFSGARINVNEDMTQRLNAIPISLTYQIDIYTRYEEEADEYVRNFVFNILNYPKLKIRIPYNSANIEHESTIRILPEIYDNSDIPERLTPGQFTRFTLSVIIDNAYLFSAPIKDNLKLDVETDVSIKTNISTRLKEREDA